MTPMRWIERAAMGARAAAWIVLAPALVAGGCGTAHEQGGPDRNAATATASATSTPAPVSAIAGDAGPAGDAGDADAAGAEGIAEGDAGADGGASAEAPDPPRKRSGELARFFGALDELQAKTRKDHVRILWLGDSHGQADFWSGRVRSALQKKFGNGGPGFVHLAFKGYRHDGLDLAFKDKWHTTPKGPSSGKRSYDGVFGLGGLLTSSEEAQSEASIEVKDSSASKKLHWDLCYRFAKGGDTISVSLPGQRTVKLSPGGKLAQPAPLMHASFKSEPPGDAADTKSKSPTQKLTVTTNGYSFFCGVVIETDPLDNPGVVLDQLGINGARYSTVLAWDEEAWLAEYMRRSPALVILEYGTNEAGDVGIPVETHAEKVAKVVTRLRKKRPETDCLILAPTERADQEERSGRIRDVLKEAAKANSCWFWDTIDAMGGKGSMRTWRDENPPRAAKDGIHLSVRGYQELGDKLAQDILKKY